MGVAVSGGADSLALMTLYARWKAATGRAQTALVVTVDHGLRPGAANEAAFVARVAGSAGLAHETLTWEGEKPATGLPAAARTARYRLLGRRAATLPSPCAIITAHTQDDQAETLLMRLARGSGIDGLAGMRPVAPLPGVPATALVRPLLGLPKARLEATLRSASVSWIDDPTNTDLRFERPKLRALATLRTQAALTDAALARSAARLARAAAGLEYATGMLETAAVSIIPGAMATIDLPRFEAAPPELQVRLLGRLLARHGGEHPRARLSEIERLAGGLSSMTGAATLGGCTITPGGSAISIVREPGRTGLPELQLEPGESLTWDARFHVSLAAGASRPVTVRAPSHAEWQAMRPPDTPRDVNRFSLTLPFFWTGTTLVSIAALHRSGPAPAVCEDAYHLGQHCTVVAV